MRRAFFLCCFLLASTAFASDKPAPADFRPVAVPLVVVDPYFSIWSFADHLTYEPTRHWTGTRMTMQSIVRVDGKSYRIMGDEPRIIVPAQQTSLRVFPTRTVYEFQAGAVRVQLTFLTPNLPQDIDVLSRPVTYLAWQASSTDGRAHKVEIFYDNSAELVVNTPDQRVDWKKQKIGDLDALRMGTADQPVLGRSGDSVRIDWGYLYAAAPRGESPQAVVLPGEKAAAQFVSSGALSSPMDTNMPRAAGDHWPVMAIAFNLGEVNAAPVSRHMVLAYDEIYPIEFLHHRLRPYWHRSQRTIGDLLQSADRDFPSLNDRSRQFDEDLMAALSRLGGEEYAEVAALAYRQAFGANKLASGSNGTPRMFLKEISSCGCAQTADVIYPESPILLLLNPKLLEYSLIPLIEYAKSGQWPYPYAPHDLGTYPIDDGRVAQRMESMPVEESGNMLLMIAGITKAEGNADFAATYWPLVSKWAEYLKANGLDPGNQLCTDDFTGLLAHNANLSLKAIVALGGYAMMARMLGKTSTADSFERTAKDYAQKWLQLAADGDHTRLAFDRPGTWSEKYNLIWDRVLGLNLFPPSLAEQELAFYSKQATPFGFPLDSRTAFTKLDWESWSAALATSHEQFASIFRGMYGFADASPTRVPLSDWYWTTDGTQTGFQARPVVGGIFMQMLTDPAVWKKWATAAPTDH